MVEFMDDLLLLTHLNYLVKSVLKVEVSDNIFKNSGQYFFLNVLIGFWKYVIKKNIISPL